MAELKTKPRRASVTAFLAAIPDARARKDAQTVSRMMKGLTGKAPRMWGASIVGFGDLHLRYVSGRELDWFVIGFSPRKPALVLYLGLGGGLSAPLLKKLGPHKLGKGCLNLRSLEEIKLPVLEDLMRAAISKAGAKA